MSDSQQTGVTFPDDEPRRLQDRIDYLEELNRWHTSVLDIFSTIGDVYETRAGGRSPEHVVEAVVPYLRRICEFESLGFCFVEEDSADFQLGLVEPEMARVDLQINLNDLIDSGDFAWALNQTFPLIVELDAGRRFLLNVLATPSRIRGMFIGKLPGDLDLPERARRVVGAILQNCAYALESAELYRWAKEKNEQLKLVLAFRSKELAYRARHDSLTNLLTREHFQEEVKNALSRAKRGKHMVALILLDLDHFKRVNESLGHSMGDELLKQFATRLSSCVREYDVIFRSPNQPDETESIQICNFGGDEFCILLGDLAEFSHVSVVLSRISKAMEAPFDMAHEKIVQRFSAGISYYPEHAESVEKLLQFADIALYHAKMQGKHCQVVYSPAMKDESEHFFALANKIHYALEKQQFLLYYQPQIDTRTHRVIGLEALIRWRDDDNNWIQPDHFIPLAEEFGLIGEIGDWVFDEACRFVKRLRQAGYSDIPISVNISSHQFTQRNFLQNVLDMLDAHHVPPNLIEIELTERAIMRDVENTIATLNSLHEHGLSISVDDFGTGYSSLSYLKRFPLDTLKIDRSFINDVANNAEDAAIVTAITALAHSLDMDVIAEGVETEEQIIFLNALKVHYIQGYYFSRPLNAEDLMHFLFQHYKPNQQCG